MVLEITSASDLVEFIQNNRDDKLVIEFKASWCQGSFVLRTHFHKFATRYSQGNLKFASVDVDYAGLQNLNSSRNDLNLGAIPAFYVFKNNTLYEMLVTCSFTKLDLFIKSHFEGNIIDTHDNEPQLVKVVTEAKSKEVKIKAHQSKKLVSDESPTGKQPQLVKQMSSMPLFDRRVSYDSRLSQLDKRSMADQNAHNLDRRVSSDLSRANNSDRTLSPNLLMKFKSKFLKKREPNNADSDNFKNPNRNLDESPTRNQIHLDRRQSYTARPTQLERNISYDQSNSKYPDRGLSPDAVMKAKNKFLNIRSSNNNDLDINSSNLVRRSSNCLKQAQLEKNSLNNSYDSNNLKSSYDLNLDRRVSSELILKAKKKFLSSRNENS